MTTNLFKGGKNHKAPYETTHVRTPVSIRFVLQKIIDLYKTTVASKDILAPSQFIEELVYFLKGYKTWAGIVIKENKVMSMEYYENTLKQLGDAADEIDRLKVQIHFHEAARQDIKAHLEEACKLKPNAGGAIKKKIREVIEILD